MRWIGALVSLAVAACALPVQARDGYMTGTEIRRAVSGVTIDGVYPGGVAWTETYKTDGKIDYMETGKRMTGQWSLEGAVFCTLYNGGSEGGCWRVRSVGANCFVFYITTRPRPGQGTTATIPVDKTWGAMGWRQGVTSTCEGRPTV